MEPVTHPVASRADLDDLDDLAQAMAHWLEAAQARSGDRAASAQALAEARRRLIAHQDQHELNSIDKALFRECTAPRLAG
jgi:hypothetical protein